MLEKEKKKMSLQNPIKLILFRQHTADFPEMPHKFVECGSVFCLRRYKKQHVSYCIVEVFLACVPLQYSREKKESQMLKKAKHVHAVNLSHKMHENVSWGLK